MSKIILYYILMIGFISVNAQVNPLVIGNMPAQIDESSGLEITSPGNLWSHNDTDSDPRIFKLNESGSLIGNIDLANVSVIDFEDVAYDGVINFYIGEFGNNLNDRNDLKIYKIPNPELLSGSVIPEVINFTLSDQTSFPPSPGNLNYDIESMFFYNNHLHLFTRNRTNPYDGLTKHYKLVPEAGTQEAELQGTFFGNLSDEYSSITAADISPDGTRMVLLTEGSVFLFHNFSGDEFFNGESHYNFFDEISAKEGIVFKDECQLMISEESPDGINPGRLFSLNSCDLVPIGIEDINSEKSHFSIVQNNGYVTVSTEKNPNFELYLVDALGKLVYVKNDIKYVHQFTVIDWPSGIYNLRVTSTGQAFNFKILISN